MMASEARYTRDDIEKLDNLFSAIDFCAEVGINYGQLETVDEVKLLLLSRLNKPSTAENVNQRNQQRLKETLAEDRRRISKLCDLYADLEGFLTSDRIEETTKEELEQYSPGYMDILRKNIVDLKQHECPIVLAGETSSGKSTILNLLLGETVLPEAVLHATSIICHIRNGEQKTAKFCGDCVVTLDLDDEENLAKLEKLIRCSNNPNNEVFITWPIPMLQGHVSIVDTPGIGEPEMTKKVMEYLPRAAAFIYVVNCANAGGVQKDMLIKVVKRQCSTMGLHDHIQIFDPQSAIFVLNKWDTVPKNEANDVTEKIYKSLRKVWHGLDRSQLYHLSATEATRCLKRGAGRTEKFSKLWDAIERLIPLSLEMNTRSYFDWLWIILKTTQKIIYMRVANAEENQKETRYREKDLRERLAVLRDDADSIMEELSELLTQKSDQIVDELYELLRSGDVITRLSTWDEGEVPDGNDMDIINYQVEAKINERIIFEIMEWRDKSNVFDNILREIYRLFKDKFRILDEEFWKWDKDLNFCTQNDAPEVGLQQEDGGIVRKGFFGQTERLVLGLTMPLWAPLAVVASVVVLPFIGSLAVKESIRKKSMLQKYKANSTAFISQWTMQVIEKLTKPVIKSAFVDRHMESLWEKVTLLKQVIPRQLQADNQLIVNVLNDVRSSALILKLYTPLQRGCRALVAKCRLLRLQHFDPDKITMSQITLGNRIDSGTFADVFDGEYITRTGIRHRAAIKILRKQSCNHEAMQVQSAEVDILRNLQHENVVLLHGVVCEEEPERRFYIVMELCVCTLKDAVFGYPGRIAGNHVESSASGSVARNYFKTMIRQILVGLEFIHKKGYVHRDIKLSNILLTADNIVKISDVGMSPYEEDITSTLCGTWSHVAPEVIQGLNYRQPADIYSLGIMMWELWYGRSAYSDDADMYKQFEPMQLLMAVVDGVRPSFRSRERPPNNLMQLILQCWKDQPVDRPTAADCLYHIDHLDLTV